MNSLSEVVWGLDCGLMKNVPGRLVPSGWGVIGGASRVKVKVRAELLVIIVSGNVTFISDAFKTGFVKK